MGIFRELVELRKDLKDIDPLEKANIIRHRSINRWANEAILYFPLLISNAIDKDTAQLTMKSFERRYADLIMIINGIFNKTHAENAEQYIRKIHQNTNIDRDMQLKDINDMLEESYCPLSEAYVDDADFNEVLLESIQQKMSDNKKLSVKDLQTIRKTISESQDEIELTLEDCDVDNVEVINLKEASISQLKYVLKSYSDGRLNGDSYLIDNAIVTVNESSYDIMFLVGNEEKCVMLGEGFNRLESQKEKYTLQLNESLALKEGLSTYDDIFNMQTLSEVKGTDHARVVADGGINNQIKVVNKMPRNNVGDLNNTRSSTRFTDRDKMLLNSDVKKSNEMTPTKMVLRATITDKSGQNPTDIEFIVGIKATLHPIDSDVMINEIKKGLTSNRKIFNFVRWFTGEIKFFKDFLFAVDQLKSDALNMKNRGTAWFTVLKRRKRVAGISRRIMSNKSILPNSTIILTAEENEELKMSGIDMCNVKFAKKLIDDYFLLAVAIVDKEMEIIKILFDGTHDYEEYSFSSLEREANNYNHLKGYKDMMSVMNKF